MSWISGMLKELNTLREKILNMPEPSLGSHAPHDAPPEQEQINYTDFRTDQLKVMAKERGLKGYSKLNKGQLVELLQEN